jgi:hypothetical protein
MKQEIKDFVEGYNKTMEWNKEILESFGKGYVHSYTKKFIKEYLSTNKITEEGYDLENAKLYTYEQTGTQELQAFSNKTYGTTYFWFKPGETEEEYKKRKMDSVGRYALERLKEISMEMAALDGEKSEFERIRDGLNF